MQFHWYKFVAKQITDQQARAATTDCHRHSFSLAVKSVTTKCNVLRDTMVTIGEICVLIKFSPKREKPLGKITENIEVKLVEGSQKDLNEAISVLHLSFYPPASRKSSIITHFSWTMGWVPHDNPRVWYKVENNWLSETNEILCFLFWPSSEQNVVRYDRQPIQNASKRKDVSHYRKKSSWPNYKYIVKCEKQWRLFLFWDNEESCK